MRLSLLACISIVIMACAAVSPPGESERSNDPQAVLNISWQWVSTVTPVEKIDVTAPDRYTVFLAPDGKARLLFDCNRGGGDYSITQGKLSFGPLISTRMACPPDSLDGPFMRDLQRVVSFFVENGELFLELPYDSGTMRFQVQK